MINRAEQEIMQHWKGDKNTPIVSICSITYNHEEYIAEALDSFLLQETDFPFEIVLDDDCSIDETPLIIQNYKKKYPSIIKLNCRSTNVGMIKNFIENVQRAEGDFIALCEGDDYWIDPHKLIHQVKYMQKYPKYNLSFHPAKIKHSNKINGLTANHNAKDITYSVEDLIIKGGEFCPTASIMVRKKVINRIPDWFIKDAPVADYYFQLLASLDKGALYLNQAMSIYRVDHDGSWVSQMKKSKNIDKLKYTNIKHIDTLIKYKDIMGSKYSIVLESKISEKIINLSLIYLYSFNYDLFLYNIENNRLSYNEFTLKVKMIYKLRKHPKILFFLIKLKFLLNNLLSS